MASVGNINDMSFFKKQTDMFKNVFKSINKTNRTQIDVSEQITRSSKVLKGVLRNTTRGELRREFSTLGNDLRTYQRLLRKYNAQNEDDLQRLVRIGKRFYDNEDDVKKMQDNFEKALGEMQNKTTETSGKMRENLALLGISDMQGRVDDDASSITDLSNEIKKIAGLNADQAQALRQGLLGSMKDINNGVGFSLVNYKDLLESAKSVTENTNVSDPEMIEKIAKNMVLLQNSSNVSDDSASKALEKIIHQRGFDDNQTKDFMDSFVNVVHNQNVDDTKIMESVNILSDAVSTFANGNNDLAESMNQSIMKSSVLFEKNFLDSDAFMNTFKDAVLNNDPEAMQKMTTQLSQVGMSINDAQQAFVSGNFDDFSADYVKSVGELFKNTSGHNRAALADIYGIDPEQINKFMDVSSEAEMQMQDISRSLEEGSGAMGQASEQTKLWHERLINWMSGMTLFGNDLGSLVESFGANPLQLYASIMIAKDALSSLGKGVDWTRDTLKNFRGKGGIKGATSRVGQFATKIGTTAITSLVSLATTIWTTVIPALVAMSKNAWSRVTDFFGLGKKGGKGKIKSPTYDKYKGGAWKSAKATGEALDTAGDVAKGASKLGSLGKTLGILGTLGFGAFNIATSDDKSKAVAETAGGALGGWGGASAGAAIGTAILPGIGTAVGGLVGGLGGGWLGSWLGGKTNKLFGGDDAYNEAEKNAKEALINSSPHYAVGTPYVPQDGLAYVHQGEAIIPADLNNPVPMNDIAEISKSANTIAMEEKLAERHRDAKRPDSSQVVDMDSVVEAINTLTSFMKFWHQDELERDRRKERRTDPFAGQRQTITNWGV